MSDGHRTSTIPRPRDRDDTPTPPRSPRLRASDQTSSLLRDFTTPIQRDKQLVPQRRGRFVVAVFAVIISVAIGAALFVLPVRSWLQQRDDLATRQAELNTLNAANEQLQSEVDRLTTNEGIREAAREEIDYVEAGEQRITVLPSTNSSVMLPTGWPFDIVAAIVTLRQAEAVAPTEMREAAETTVVAETTAPATTP